MNEKKAVTKHYLCAMNNRGQVRAKKHLGQHFLKDESIAERIANVVPFDGVEKVLEIGPGMGVMTKYLLELEKYTEKENLKFNMNKITFTI